MSQLHGVEFKWRYILRTMSRLFIMINGEVRIKNVEPLEKPWTGKTLFKISTGGETVDKPVVESKNPNASSSTAPPPADASKETAETIEDDLLDNPPSLPAALARIHARLAKRPELVKLQQKNYHMNMEQFKFRTKALHLPKSIYEQYQEILDSCEPCQKNKNAPSRSRTSGLRSEVFGRDDISWSLWSVSACLVVQRLSCW